MSIQLGHTVKDQITGFTGIATGRCVYITGCTQVLVTPKVDEKNASADSRWVDEDRLRADATPQVFLTHTAAGFDKSAPIR